jgi:hypothetical protein
VKVFSIRKLLLGLGVGVGIFWTEIPAANSSHSAAKAGPESASLNSVFDPARDGVAFTNYADLLMGGYCLGISSVHAFSRFSPEERRKIFGETVENWFQKNPAVDEESAMKAARMFATLQTQEKFQEMLRKIPGIFTKVQKQETSLQIDYKALKSKEKEDLEKSRAQIEKFHKYLGTAKGRREGLMATVNVGKYLQKDAEVIPGSKFTYFELAGGHSLYFFDSKLVDGKYELSYIDPNVPKKVQKMIYNPADADASFSFKHPTLQYVLDRFYTTEDSAKMYADTIKSIKNQKTMLKVAQVGFLNLAEPNDKAQNGIFSPHEKQSPAQIEASLERIQLEYVDLHTKKFVLNEALVKPKELPKGASKREIMKSIHENQKIIAQTMKSIGQRQAREEEELLMFRFASQAQLDKGCEEFKNFFDVAIQKKKEVARDHIMNLYLQMLLSKYAQALDGERKDVAPKGALEQQRCLSDTITPWLIATHPDYLKARLDKVTADPNSAPGKYLASLQAQLKKRLAKK